MIIHISKIRNLKLAITEQIESLHDEIVYGIPDEYTIELYKQFTKILDTLKYNQPTTALINIDIDKKFEQDIIDIYNQFIDITNSNPSLLD